MPQKTKTRWVSVSLRLFVFISLLVITPLGILKAEGYGYSMWFLIALVVILLPDAFIKLFLQPIAVTWDEQHLVFTYLMGIKRRVKVAYLVGYRTTEEATRYGIEKGIRLYIGHKMKKIHFTTINIRDIAALHLFLDRQDIPCYGTVDVKPWFVF